MSSLSNARTDIKTDALLALGKSQEAKDDVGRD